MGIPAVIVESGGIPVTISDNASPFEIAENGFGIAITIVESGGLPVSGISAGSEPPGDPVTLYDADPALTDSDPGNVSTTFRMVVPITGDGQDELRVTIKPGNTDDLTVLGVGVGEFVADSLGSTADPVIECLFSAASGFATATTEQVSDWVDISSLDLQDGDSVVVALTTGTSGHASLSYNAAQVGGVNTYWQTGTHWNVQDTSGLGFASLPGYNFGLVKVETRTAGSEPEPTPSEMPGVDNRPSVSAGTITWTGPVDGGASDGSDVEQSHAITASALTATTSDGQVVEYLDFSDTFEINHANVTFRRCRIKGGGFVMLSVEGTGAIIEDCEIDGTGGQQYQGISHLADYSFTGATIRRCNIHHMENGVTAGVQNVTVEDCWFHDFAGPDCDQVELYGGSTAVIVQRNTFDGVGTSGSFVNSGVNVTNYLGTVTNVEVTDNWFRNFVSFAICDDQDQGGGSVTWSCEGNGFYSNGSYRRGGTTASPNSGNYVMATDTATTGTAVNGTGAV